MYILDNSSNFVSSPSGDSSFITNESWELVEQAWAEITSEFAAYADVPERPRMQREELSFHSLVKMLGHLCLELESLSGDFVEIGVWKGKSLALMSRLSTSAKVIGIDPLVFDQQKEELNYFKERIFNKAIIVPNFSEIALKEVLDLTRNFKLLHIDGGHQSKNVVLDFLLYSPFVVSGGYVVMDDYADFQFSPEVGPTVDLLIKYGFTSEFELIGQVKEFPNSFLLKKY